MTKEEIKLVNKTAISNGAVGKNALIPRIITGRYPYLGYTILDFGAGPKAIQTNYLNAKGYNVTPYDIGDNIVDGVHLIETEEDKGLYDLIFASNVFNILPSVEAWKEAIEKILWFLSDDGFVMINLPLSPRKCKEINKEKALQILRADWSE